MNKAWRAFEADPLEGMAQGPYPGLRPFLPRERDIFFGREQMIDQVLVRLNEQHMVVVHGASGCGKSSLIAAGVLPQLARRRARRGLVLKTGTFRPGIQPVQSLVGLIGELCGTDAGPAPLDAVYRAISGGPGVARAGVARLAAEAGVDQLCIVIDQFEELFRFAEDEGFEEAQRFADLLVQLCGGGSEEGGWWEADGASRPAEPVPAEISFILTMRSEFLGNCARYRGLAEAINHTQYLLPNMGRDDLIRAIREPAGVFEGNVDHALAERMADDAAREEDSLPLVQHALMQMWRASESRTLTLADYEQALDHCAQGDQAKLRGPLSAILAGHADGVLAEVTGGDAARLSAAEFIFRALSRKDSESRATRCPQRYWRLARISGVSDAETRAIIDGFRGDGVSFLTPYAAMGEEIEGETVVDISHEALIRAWPRMSDRAIDDQAQPVGWIEREAQDAMLWRWLAVHADFFRSNPRAYLDGATSERLGAWFERIKARPDWVRPHLVRPEGKDDVTQEPEWLAVERLLQKSDEYTGSLLRRWRRLGWVSIALIVLLIAGGGWGAYTLLGQWKQEQVKDRQDETTANVDNRRVAAMVQQTDALLLDRDKRAGAAADVEVVDQRTADAATAGGSFINAPDGQGYIWIGTIASANPPIINLRGGGDRAISPDAPHRGSTYRVENNTIVRAAAPAPDLAPRSVGIVARNSLVTIVGLADPVESDGRTEYWARVTLARTSLSRVRVSLAHVPRETGEQMSRQLTQLGYRLVTDAAPVDATSRADVLYCHDEDRRAAVRLAATVTRWIVQNAQIQGITVTPVPGDDCEGVATNELILLLDLTPPAAEGP